MAIFSEISIGMATIPKQPVRICAYRLFQSVDGDNGQYAVPLRRLSIASMPRAIMSLVVFITR